MYFEAAISYRPHPGKDHDRHVIDQDRQLAVVLDGAGNAFASQIGKAVFESMAEANLPEMFFEAQSRILSKYSGGIYTTAVAVKIAGESVQYACAGDSRIYAFANTQLQQLTEDECEFLRDARNFLGSPVHVLKQIGKVSVAETLKLLLVSDGVTDHYAATGAVSNQKIAEIMAADLSPETAADAIVEAAAIEDDATAVVAHFRR